MSTQNDKLGLDKSTAQSVASQALRTSASQQDKDALTTVLMQKGQSSNFKNSLITFLITTGKIVAKAYGIPTP